MAEYGKPNDRLKEITDRLEQGIQDLFNSKRYAAYLKTMSKFYSYSFNNTLLIALQRPDATLVAGYNAWQNNFKRHVKRGERGIKILAPCPVKRQVEMEKIDPVTRQAVKGPDGKPVTEKMEITTPAFKVVTVFDVSQTDGAPLPALGVDELTGDVAQYPDFFEALKRVSPMPIGFEKITGSAKGYCNYEERRIAIQEGMSEVQNVKTAIHEITHARLHDIHREKEKDIPVELRKDRNTREVEAESVAYTVCQHYGIDTSDYSFAYIAGWSSGRETREMKASLELIRSTAAGLITDIDDNFRELVQARAQTQEKMLATGDTFTIYQLKDGPETRDLRFEPLERLQAAGLAFDPANYREVYSAPLAGTDTLESIYQRFNLNLPEDFNGHSLSVSDVVVLCRAGEDTAHYVDSFGFSQVPGFLSPPPLPPELDPSLQPVVTVLWSEHERFQEGEKMPLYQADPLFRELDERQRREREQPGYQGLWYCKTKFQIEYMQRGEIGIYEGRQDLGDGDGGLIDHIRAHADHYRHDRQWQAYLASKDSEKLAATNATYEAVLTDFVPYLRLHCNLSQMEQASKEALRTLRQAADPAPYDLRRIAFHEAAQAYVSDCRHALNTATGTYQLPKAPRLENFSPSFQPPGNYLATAEKTVEQNYNMLDGRINNTPPLDSIEARMKRGEAVSLSEIAAAKKPSITEQLKPPPPTERKPRPEKIAEPERG